MGMLKVIQNTNSSEDYLENAIDYILLKADTVAYGAYGINPLNAYEQMMIVKQYFGKTSGNQLMHFIVSFSRYVSDVKTALYFANRIAQYYGNYQCVYSVHEKAVYYNGRIKSLYHVHFIMNSVSFTDGRMFSQSKGEIGQFKKYIEQVTRDKHFKVVYSSDDRD